MTRDPDFLKFWIGQSISVFGSQFSPIAIGAIAYFSLKANGFQFGVLAFMNTIPFSPSDCSRVFTWIDTGVGE